ncbi:YheC/YheD family protein [Gorillibacterium sp. sgz5001074]|uniref:YheC/YheD family protein n=1 Tax=Gorillibacterium sp. sgz5001074 TaxID=3446695 RepID=UPI003F67A8D4
MISRRVWHVRDKWKRHLALVPNRSVARHIPPTRLLGRSSLREYLNRYNVVFVKPVFGSFGNNILKVSKQGQSVLIQRERRVRSYKTEQVPEVVFRHAGRRPFLIQKGVRLAQIGGKPIDFRLLLLRPNNEWLVMGIMGKIAESNRAVTNFNHGGKPVGYERAMQLAGFAPQDIRRIKSEMTRIGLSAARTFQRRYKHCRRMGIDFAVDRDGRLWILEVNTNPYYDLFRYHRDRSLHGTIDRYMKQIGRLQSNR